MIDQTNRPGPKPTTAGTYAKQLGIRIDRLRSLGGMKHLQSMSDEARALIVKPHYRRGAAPLTRRQTSTLLPLEPQTERTTKARAA